MPKLSRPSILFDHDDDDGYAALIERQKNTDKNKDKHKGSQCMPTGSTVAV